MAISIQDAFGNDVYIGNRVFWRGRNGFKIGTVKKIVIERVKISLKVKDNKSFTYSILPRNTVRAFPPNGNELTVPKMAKLDKDNKDIQSYGKI